jgi:anti-anti-sigma regulatory factor
VRCRLIGRLDAQSAEEVRTFLSGRPPVTIVDATELLFADAAGLALLADAKAAGARIEGLSPYLTLLADRAEQQATERGRPEG